jgi:RNA polymerase sigma-70 factor (ECF subfamily)
LNVRDLFELRASIRLGNLWPMSDVAGTVSALLAPPLESTNDENGLIRAAQRGDQAAFESLVREYDRSVLRLAVNLLHSPDEARDVYQEAFLKVYRNLGSFRFDCSFHTWLYRIVTNVCLDHLRRRKVRKEESTVVETPDGPVDQASKVVEESSFGNPERRAWNRELSAGITAALETLTPRERTVFELRHYEGLRLRAIGEILGTTEEAAKNCLFRATQKMRASLETFV